VSWWSSDDPRRRAAFVVAMLVGSAIAGFGAGSVLGLADDGSTIKASPTETSSSSPSPSPSPTTSPRKRAASEIERGTTSDIGYFVGSRSEKDGTHVTFDRVLLLAGEDAKAYAKAYHKKKPKDDGALLVNDNDLTRDLVLAEDVKVVGTRQLAGSSDPTPVPLETLLDAIASRGPELLLDLTYDKLGYVTKVQEHDLPQD
jgi:hypothetical protein